MIANRTLDGVVFIPAFVTLAVQLLAFIFARGLTARTSRRLDSAGFSVEQRGFALQTVQGFALLTQIFTGGLAVLFALQLTAAATAPLGRRWGIVITFVTVTVYALLACVALYWDRLYEEINNHPRVRLPWYDRLMLQVAMKDYGTLLTWVVIVVTLAAQVLTAFLALPVATG